MDASEFRFMDLVKVVRKSEGVILLEAANMALISFYEGALGRVVGVKSGQQITLWFPIPGYPDQKPQLGTFSPGNLELVKRPSEAEFNTMAYPYPVDR